MIYHSFEFFSQKFYRFVETNVETNECKRLENEKCIGGYARIISVVKELKKVRPNSIYLNAGDNFAGTIWYMIDRWNVTSYFLNLLPADVMVWKTFQNIEFLSKRFIQIV